MATQPDIPIMTFPDASAWETWLKSNHSLQTGIWMKIAKKNSGIASVSYAEAVDTALCYGWIDGLVKSFDENYYLQKFTPRRKRSLWSKVNIGKAEALIAAGRMHAPGLAEIELAQADGRWDAAYESQANAVVPADLQLALEQNEKAKLFFDTLTRAEKYSVLWRLMTARTPAIRASRLQKMVTTLESGSKI